MTEVKKMNELNKNLQGFYNEKEFKSLNTTEKIMLMFKETSYQDVMNIIRIEAVRIEALKQNKKI